MLEKAQLVMSSFRTSSKGLHILWAYQMKVCHSTTEFDWMISNDEYQAYEQRRSLVLNVLTKWGTIIGVLASVLENHQALLNYFQQDKPGIDQGRNHPD